MLGLTLTRPPRVLCGGVLVVCLCVTCFSFYRADVYLLLEYASRGDLHTTLRRAGSLALANTRFLAAEICVGLRHVHGTLAVTYTNRTPQKLHTQPREVHPSNTTGRQTSG